MSVAIVGVGAMGGALLEGFLLGGQPANDVVVVGSAPERSEAIAAEYGVRAASLDEAWAADIVVLAVKPYQVPDLLADATPSDSTVVVSVAAGVTIEQLETLAPAGAALVRVMPNTGSRFGLGMSGVVRGSSVPDDGFASVIELFDRVGETLVVGEEKLDALMAISGSGPAYLFYVAEAMIEAGVHQGLTRAESELLVSQTFAGSSAQLSDSGKSATQLREAVTSPAGTTAAALRKLDDHAVRGAFLAAVEACRARALQMAAGSR